MSAETTAVAKCDEFRALIESPKMQNEIKAVLPRHLTPERMTKLMLLAALKTPKLRECSRASIAQCMMASSETGLEPGGSLGQCYIIPYGNTATFLIGYRGMIDLARRSGQIQSIEAHVVYKADKFKCTFGANPVLEHDPNWESERKDADIVCAYAVAKLKDGGTQIEVMTKPEIDAIRKRSRAGTSGPWVTDYAEMCKKTCVRRLFKYLPVSAEIADAISKEDESQGTIESEVIENANSTLTPGRHSTRKAAKVEATVVETTGTVVDLKPEEHTDAEQRGGDENPLDFQDKSPTAAAQAKP